MQLALLEFMKKFENTSDRNYPPDYIPDLIEAYIAFKNSHCNDELFIHLADKIVLSILTVLNEIYKILQEKSNPYTEICLFVIDILKNLSKEGVCYGK